MAELTEDDFTPGPKIDALVAKHIVGVGMGDTYPSYSRNIHHAILACVPEMRKKGFGLLLEDLTVEEEIWAASFGGFACEHASPAFAICVAALKAKKVIAV